jgi:hypothetical protein
MTVLMPVICWKMASRTPTITSGRTLGDRRSRTPAFRRLTSRTSRISASMSLSYRTRRSTARASSSLPCLMSQCGLSVWKSIPRNSAAAGIAARPNISRQFPVPESP